MVCRDENRSPICFRPASKTEVLRLFFAMGVRMYANMQRKDE